MLEVSTSIGLFVGLFHRYWSLLLDYFDIFLPDDASRVKMLVLEVILSVNFVSRSLFVDIGLFLHIV